GTQTYTCGADGVFGTASTPEAVLQSLDHPLNFIHHYAGPRWTFLRDKSTLLGTVVTRVDQPGTIPWLLLSVVDEAPGYLDDIAYVTRVNTSGGTAPAGACTPGATVAVPYSANYVFWEPRD
ncbi:MAG: DUF3455 domain-containing protein, partial [Micromonosporaceae bacterium]|nr:DUF3455 domain-containing protein [Micromonosporaceae bacterium]